MIVTKDANKITRLMGLSIMQASKNFQEPKAPKDFRKIEYYFEDFCETHEQLGMSGYSTSARIYSKGYSCGKELLGSRHKVFSEQ